MILKRLEIEGVTRFNRVELDLTQAGPGLFAISGSNGAGKTTLLECSGYTALYREFATRPDPNLKNYVKGQGRLALAFEYLGSDFEVEHLFPARGTPTSFLARDGAQQCTGKTGDFDREILSLFGPASAFLASCFAAQGGGGRFASLAVAGRRELFRYLLGLDRLAQINETAKAMLAQVDLTAIDRLEAEKALLTLRRTEAGLRIENATLKATEARQKVENAEARVATARQEEGALDPWRAYDELVSKLARKGLALEALQARVPTDIPGPEASLFFEEVMARKEEVERLNRDIQWDRDDLRNRKSALADAEAQIEKSKTVPCGGKLHFAKCPFLDGLVEARQLIAEEAEPVALASADLDANALYARVESSRWGEDWRKANADILKRTEHARVLGQIDALRVEIAGDRKAALELRRSLPKERPGASTEPHTLAELSALLKAVRRDLEVAIQGEAVARTEFAAAEKRLREIEQELDGQRENISKAEALRILTRAFGPAGIQAMEIDASGPAISALANSLLHGAYGDRFSVEIRTQRQLKGGRNELTEDFSLHVVDSERGREGPIGALSGGEQVIIDEALRNALGLFSADIGRSSIQTLWRDETPAALYGEGQPRYVNMLQTALKIGSFQRILFVGGEIAADGADHTIHVGDDGSVTLE